MKTPLTISKLTLTALRPLLLPSVLAAIVAVAVVSLPTPPTGAQDPAPTQDPIPTQDPVPAAPVTGISVRDSRGLMMDGSQGVRTMVQWERSNPGQYIRIGYVNLTAFLETARDDSTWPDVVQWRSIGSDRAVRWVMFNGQLTPGDLYAFTVTAATDATSEPHWPNPNWITYRVNGKDATNPPETPTPSPGEPATPTPAPTTAPTPTTAPPDDVCESPFAPIIAECQ